MRRVPLRHVIVFLLLTAAWLVLAASTELVVAAVGALIVLFTMIIFPSLHIEIVSLSAVRRLFRLSAFLVYILPALLLASIRLASLTVRPSVAVCSRVLRYNYVIGDRLGLLLLSVTITLTPGTLVLDVDPQRNALYIHNLDRQNVSVEQTLKSINAIERRLLGVFP